LRITSISPRRYIVSPSLGLHSNALMRYLCALSLFRCSAKIIEEYL